MEYVSANPLSSFLEGSIMFHAFNFIAAGLAQSVERLTAEWKVASSFPGTGPILKVLK